MRRKTIAEKATTKRNLDAARAKTRVNIGSAFQRWRNLKRIHPQLKKDEEVAEFLLDSISGSGAEAMPWRCCVPGCKGYDEARSLGVVFHGLPTRDPERCRIWLRTIQNPRLHEDMPASKYSGVRVCSLHFRPDDYEEDFRAKILNTTPKPSLKSGAVPSVFPGRENREAGSSDASPRPAPKRSRAPSVSAAAGGSSPSHPADDSFCIVVSVDSLDDSCESDEDEGDEDEEDCAIVHHQNLMELFQMCQTCGQPIADKQVFHSGAQTRVTWSCRGGHAGTWRSSPHLRHTLK
ncbi:uncharacterized protein LOC133983108 isoform X2 [Scomber scombrus]|uniref:uncharacterized protein LOC133983108 isoform X2 n=1 Tax=Scomber scombrus TaxID=13677 RepID=UPI002DDC52C8|nr:uncharacterized protein LOC133983108 isoform X2 [Scomber scombrus]